MCSNRLILIFQSVANSLKILSKFMLILKAFMLNLIVVYTASNHQIAIFRPIV